LSEVAQELIEPLHGRQELIAVAEMILAELRRGVAQRAEQFNR
jgi:hypothetical protein